MTAPAQHQRMPPRTAWALLWLLLAVSFVLAVALGAVSLPLSHVLRALTGAHLPGFSAEIIQSIRLPRALLAAAVGALLALGGAFMQGLFRNPLADPSLIGVSAGASVGASVAIVLGASSLAFLGGLSLVSLGAFVGGLLAAWLVYRAANTVNGTSVVTMLLMGIAVSALAASATGLLDYFADNQKLRRMSLWRMGGLDGANYERAFLAWFIVVIQLTSIKFFARALNTLLLGESQARHLGVNVQRLKTQIIILVAAGVGTSVAMAGSIVFVGLVVPHMVRLWVGPDHRLLLPMSALGGAILVLLADTLARTVLAPTELPVGLVIALLGAPFFISLLRRRRVSGDIP